MDICDPCYVCGGKKSWNMAYVEQSNAPGTALDGVNHHHISITAHRRFAPFDRGFGMPGQYLTAYMEGDYESPVRWTQ